MSELTVDDAEWVVSVMHNPLSERWMSWRWLVRHPEYGLTFGWRWTRSGAERAAARAVRRMGQR